MRKLLLVPIVAASLALSGCFMSVVAPTPNLTVKLDATQSVRSGSSVCTQVFYAFAFGDCSVDTAMKSGNITKVHHVDAKAQMLFYGLYSTLTITAFGE
jgi:hypothetical protein